MADTYWDHPARRETKRLLDLADAGAILDELQQGGTEWDDAREALDHLVRGAQEETAAATVADPTDRTADVMAEAMPSLRPMTPERLAEIREREQAATPGPWEPGSVWLVAGLIYDDDGNRVAPDDATRCGFCNVGEPVWSGQRPINGPTMNAHRHRNPEPWSAENLISAANGDLVAGNFDYEEGGIIAPADTVFVAAAREDVPALLAEVERLRAELADEKRRNHYVRAGNAERENARLRAELAETTHALEVTAEKADAMRGQRDRAETERDRLAEQVKAVRDMHTKFVCDCGTDHGIGCAGCGADEYPWPTLHALGGTEPGQ